MSSTLDDMMQQILQSEHCAAKRKAELVKVKVQISNCIKEIQDVEKRKTLVTRQTMSQTEKLAEVKTYGRHIEIKLSILLEEKEKLHNKLDMFKEQLSEVSAQVTESQFVFSLEASRFNNTYGLSNSDSLIKGEKTKEILDQIKDSVRLLEEDLRQYKCSKEKQEEMQEQNYKQQDENGRLSEQLNEINDDMNKEELKQKELEIEKANLNKQPLDDIRIRKLQEEITNCDEDNLESVYYALKEEHKEIQRMCWKAKLKQPIYQESFKYQQNSAQT